MQPAHGLQRPNRSTATCTHRPWHLAPVPTTLIVLSLHLSPVSPPSALTPPPPPQPPSPSTTSPGWSNTCPKHCAPFAPLDDRDAPSSIAMLRLLLSCQDGKVRCYDEGGDLLAVVRLRLRSLLSPPHGIRATMHVLAALKRLVPNACAHSLRLLSCSPAATSFTPRALVPLARRVALLGLTSCLPSILSYFTSLSSPPSLGPSTLASLVRPSSFRSQGDGHTQAVASLSWTSTGQLLSGSWDGTVRVWEVRRLHSSHPNPSCCFHQPLHLSSRRCVVTGFASTVPGPKRVCSLAPLSRSAPSLSHSLAPLSRSTPLLHSPAPLFCSTLLLHSRAPLPRSTPLLCPLAHPRPVLTRSARSWPRAVRS